MEDGLNHISVNNSTTWHVHINPSVVWSYTPPQITKTRKNIIWRLVCTRGESKQTDYTLFLCSPKNATVVANKRMNTRSKINVGIVASNFKVRLVEDNLHQQAVSTTKTRAGWHVVMIHTYLSKCRKVVGMYMLKKYSFTWRFRWVAKCNKTTISAQNHQ